MALAAGGMHQSGEDPGGPAATNDGVEFHLQRTLLYQTTHETQVIFSCRTLAQPVGQVTS